MSWYGKRETHLYQVPEDHLPIFGAADHVCVTLAQAAVQLVLLILMARIPGGWGVGGISGAWAWGKGQRWDGPHDPEDSLS